MPSKVPFKFAILNVIDIRRSDKGRRLVDVFRILRHSTFIEPACLFLRAEAEQRRINSSGQQACAPPEIGALALVVEGRLQRKT